MRTVVLSRKAVEEIRELVNGSFNYFERPTARDEGFIIHYSEITTTTQSKIMELFEADGVDYEDLNEMWEDEFMYIRF